MKKFISVSISVVVCLFFIIGCSDDDCSHDEDHDLVGYEDHDILLGEELVDNRPLIERIKSVELGMTYEEVRYILGSPRGIGWNQGQTQNSTRIYFEWWYDLGEEVEDVKKRYIVIRFGNDMVIDKVYGLKQLKPWDEDDEELRRELFVR